MYSVFKLTIALPSSLPLEETRVDWFEALVWFVYKCWFWASGASIWSVLGIGFTGFKSKHATLTYIDWQEEHKKKPTELWGMSKMILQHPRRFFNICKNPATPFIGVLIATIWRSPRKKNTLPRVRLPWIVPVVSSAFLGRIYQNKHAVL